MMLRLDRGNAYNHTLKISILDPGTDPEGWSWPRFQRLFEERIHLLPTLRLRSLPTPLGLHQPIWIEDPEFKLSSHVKRVGCPDPGGRREFCELIEQIYSRPLDPERPLWETWVVEGLEGGRVGVVTLAHHAYTDGIGALGMVEDVYDTEPGQSPSQAPSFEPPPPPSAARRLRWALEDLPAVAAKVPSAIGALRDRRRLEREYADSGRELPPNPFDGSLPAPFRNGLSRDRCFAFESYSLPEFKAVTKALGMTINDGFLSCCAGAVRRYLEAEGRTPEQPMIATMPLAVLPLAEREVAGNFSSIDYVLLHTELADPLERLRLSSASAKVTKEHFEATKDADLMSLLEVTPGGLVTLLAKLNARTKGRFDPFANVVVSNVPGPRQSLYLGNWEIEHWYSTGQIAHGATLNMTVWSYRDELNLCVLADAKAVTDPWLIVAGFGESVGELKALADEERA